MQQKFFNTKTVQSVSPGPQYLHPRKSRTMSRLTKENSVKTWLLLISIGIKYSSCIATIGYNCVYYITNNTARDYKPGNEIQWLAGNNIHQIINAIRRSPRCLIRFSRDDDKILKNLSEIKRHVVLIENIPCENIPASSFQTEMYCIENGNIWEKYKVRDIVISRRLYLRKNDLNSLTEDKLIRRSNLQGAVFRVTALPAAYRTKGIEYGNPPQAGISGLFGDFFRVLSSKVNFTFSMHKPPDGKWGGRSEGRKLGWNGMVGDIAEGLVDFGIGPFTITSARSEVIQFSIGNVGYEKSFFMSTKSKNMYNFSLFIKPLTIDFWVAVIMIMFITGLVMFINIKIINDKQSSEFSLRKSFTFSITAVSFIRRWTVTPSSVSGRIVFITVLLTGVLTQV